MKREEIKAIVAEVLETDPAALAWDTDITLLPSYDSVNVLSLIVALDDRARIRLDGAKAGFRTLAELEKIAASQGVVLED